MSHKATNWLSEQTGLSASEFRVLFHLCDCHNPAKGCFPEQRYLVEKCEIAASTLNVALASLEEKRLIRRVKRFDPVTKQAKSTLYILGCDPEIDEGETADSDLGPTPKSGDGADSDFQGGPTPISGQSRLRPTGDKPVKGTSKGTSKDLFGSDEPQSDVREDRFDEFWKVYPKKVAKPEARKAWDKAIRKKDPQAIIHAAERYAKTEQVCRGFAKHPQGWLNGERFNDPDVQPVAAPAAKPYRYVQGGIVQ